MKLKFFIDNEADVPAALKDYYTERDGKWVLDTEETLFPKTKVDQFRDDAIRARKERDDAKEIKAKLDEAGITVEDAVRLKEIESDLKDQKLYKKNEIDQLKTEWAKELNDRHTKQLKAEQDKNATLTNELAVMRIDEAAVAEALKQNLEESAVEDIKMRARSTFKLIDGKPKAIGQDGFDVMEDDGITPITFKTWVARLKPNAPHLFKRSSGGGGDPSKRTTSTTTTSTKVNPWVKGDNWNMTTQGKIMREQPAVARKMMEEAGVPIPDSLKSAA